MLGREEFREHAREGQRCVEPTGQIGVRLCRDERHSEATRVESVSVVALSSRCGCPVSVDRGIGEALGIREDGIHRELQIIEHPSMLIDGRCVPKASKRARHPAVLRGLSQQVQLVNPSRRCDL